MRQVKKTLSLSVELIKSDVNLKLISIGDVFKGSNNRTVPCAYASPTSNGFLENLFHFTEITRNVIGAF